MFPMLSGYKTYIVAGLMVAKALVDMYRAYTTGEVVDVEMRSESVQMFLEGLGLGSVRAGVKKAEKG